MNFSLHFWRWEAQDQGSGKAGSILKPLGLYVIDIVCVQRDFESELFAVSSYKGTNPILRSPPTWPHLTLSICQRPLLPISHWRQWGVYVGTLRGHICIKSITFCPRYPPKPCPSHLQNTLIPSQQPPKSELILAAVLKRKVQSLIEILC